MSDDYDQPARRSNGHYMPKKSLQVVAADMTRGPIPRPRTGLALFRAVMADPMEYLTEELIEQMYDLVRCGNYPESAAASLGIPSALWKRWWESGEKLIAAINEDPSLLKIMSQDEEMILMLVQNVIQATMECEQEAVSKIMAAGNFDWAAVAWWMSKMHPAKWGRAREAVSTQTEPAQGIGDNSGVLAVSEPVPVEQWLSNNQERELAVLPVSG